MKRLQISPELAADHVATRLYLNAALADNESLIVEGLLAPTPGPWQRSGVRRKLGNEDCIVVGPDSFAIAFLPIGRRPQEQAGAIADACLISAAPDLLAALIGLGEAMRDFDGADARLIQLAALAGRAAIAKAQGRP